MKKNTIGKCEHFEKNMGKGEISHIEHSTFSTSVLLERYKESSVMPT